MTYKQVQFTGVSGEIADILIAQLSELQYEGFEEEENQLKAFIPQHLFDESALTELGRYLKMSYSVTILPDTNWNSVWKWILAPVQACLLYWRKNWAQKAFSPSITMTGVLIITGYA